jgi:hypothetical protein
MEATMNKAIAQNPLTFASFACLIAGWMLLLMFIGSRMNSDHETWLVSTGAILSIWFAPLAVLLAIAGLIFDVGRKLTLVALSLSLLSALLVFSIGG